MNNTDSMQEPAAKARDCETPEEILALLGESPDGSLELDEEQLEKVVGGSYQRRLRDARPLHQDMQVQRLVPR